MSLHLNKPALRALGIAESFQRPSTSTLCRPSFDRSPANPPTVNSPADNSPSVNPPAVNSPSVNSPAVNSPAVNSPAVNSLSANQCSANPRSILAGVVMRADRRVDGLVYAHATVGGDDATEAVLNLYRRLERRDINALLLGGAVISWFNIIDLDEVFEEIKRPLVCLTYEESAGLEKYLREYFPGSKEKIERYRSLGGRERMRLKTGHEIYVRVHGATVEEARILLNKFTLDGRVPEPVRLARMAARAARKIEEGLASGSE